MKSELMKTKEFSDIFETLDSFPRKFIDYKTLFQTTEIPKFKITNKEIRERRKLKRPAVEEELQHLMETREVYKGNNTYQRLKHMNKFYLYSGLSKQESD